MCVGPGPKLANFEMELAELEGCRNPSRKIRIDSAGGSAVAQAFR